MSLQWMTAADVMSAPTPASSPRAAGTHVVHNVPADPLVYDAFKSNPVLAVAIERSGASWAEASIAELGKLIGSSELQELARAANQQSNSRS
jgi:AidA-like protein